MARMILWFFVAITVTGCCCCFWQSDPEDIEPDPIEVERALNIPALEWAIVTYGDELEREKRVRLDNACAYFDEESIERVCLDLSTMADMYPYEARDLMVYIVEGLLARMNENPDIAASAPSFPFTIDNLIINLQYISFFGRYIDGHTLHLLQLRNSTVYYYAADAFDPDTIWYHQRIEPYAKAYRFSKYKTYRPWIKIPPSEQKDTLFRDIGQPEEEGAVFRGYTPPPASYREPAPGQRRPPTDSYGPSPLLPDSYGPPSRLPNLGEKVQQRFDTQSQTLE